ncbi:MAG: DUF2344 domain-containing protein [Candidatus Aureabacteria bacterium]|nr:DUF2344 domain-containing protein [Candidatus Auribacterota bacterium]
MSDISYVYRALYEKKGLIRFVPHLDVARMVMRALRLVVEELRFSQGFNPHPKVSFCQALSLGFESDSEYFDFEVAGRPDTELWPGEISRNLPVGLKVVRLDSLDCKTGSGEPVSCSYSVTIDRSPEYISGRLDRFNSGEAWSFRKKNGREANLRESVQEIKLLGKKGDGVELFLRINLEDQKYINPRVVICELFDYTEEDVLKFVFCRKHFNWRRKDAENTNKR